MVITRRPKPERALYVRFIISRARVSRIAMGDAQIMWNMPQA
jgi:hypothetical protein